jgi:NHL repeat
MAAGRTSEGERSKTMRARRNLVISMFFAVAALLCAALAASPAHAALVHDFNFAGTGTSGGKLNDPAGIAINHTTGDVYVADYQNHRISQFTAGGEFIRTWGLDVVAPGKPNDSGEVFEVCDTTAGNVPSDCTAGKISFMPGTFYWPTGVAVDNSDGPNGGDVYVQDRWNLRIQRFTSDGEFVVMWGKNVNATSGGDVCPRPGNPGDVCQKGSGTTGLTGFDPGTLSIGGWEALGLYNSQITVDENGYVYASSGNYFSESARVIQFDAEGNPLGYIHEKPGADPVAFDGPLELTPDLNGHIYVQNSSLGGPEFYKYPITDFNMTGVTSGSDVSFPYYGEGAKHFAVDPTNQYLFVADGLFLSPCQTVVGTAQDHVVEYSPEGELADCSPPTTQGMEFISSNFAPGIKAIAVSPAHKLYMVVGNGIRVFDTPVASAPAVDSQSASNITTNSVRLKAQVTANLASTTFHVEYGTSPCSEVPKPCDETAEVPAGASLIPADIDIQINELAPATKYYYRFVVTNSEGSETGPDKHFTTFSEQVFDPSCPNNLARQQTGSGFLLDCRAYELVSAENQGGYDVESNLVPGQTPFDGFPEATDRALYAIHNGGVPGTGNPTNRGPDPYVGTRDPQNQRWTTRYVGIPADAPSTKPFSSTVAGADSGLDNFAFGGADICDPCFPDSSAGMPLRRGEQALIQGMVGSVPVPAPEPSGEVRKHLSGDGSHFVFASEQQFEPEGNPGNGNVTIYDRDLEAGSTQVVSTLPDGSTMEEGSNVVALDVSEDGSRILVGRRVSTDPDGNDYFDLFMHLGTSPSSVEVADTPNGVLFVGMTSDGSEVLFTTRDQLADDSDTSVDLFRATVGGGLTVGRVSTGEASAGNTDGCDPAANTYNTSDWNTVPGGPSDCSVVSIGGGGGVARDSGSIYFLSPELLAGPSEGVEGAPNLYIDRPGATPQFVTTIESTANTPFKPATPIFQRFIGSFSRPVGAAVDRQDGSMYVYDLDNAFFSPGAVVQKFDSEGNPDNGFGSGSKLTGLIAVGDLSELGSPVGAPLGITVDNNPASPNFRDLYVLDFPEFAGTLKRYDSSGNLEMTVPVGGSFELPSGVAVDPSNGHVYVSVRPVFGAGSTIYVFDANGAPVAPFSFAVSGGGFGVAADSNGKVYVANGSNTEIYDGSDGSSLGTLDPEPSYGVAVDPGAFANPSDDIIYVDGGNDVRPFDSAGNSVGGPLGSGILSESVSLGADGGRLVVSNFGDGNAAVFVSGVPSDRGYDSPLVIESVRAPETRRSDLFQTNSSGEHAVFATILPLTGFDSGDKYELIRYDATDERFDCASCSPTDLPPASDAKLASDGLSVTDDGRVFFNTPEALALRDTNNELDAYEWAPEQSQAVVGACHRPGGCLELISSGKARSASGLLSVSADGLNAFFFTRETLADNDDNGNQMKLYTAREGGGFFVVPPQPSCAASDECHGPSSQAAPPASLGTLRGTGGNAKPPLHCKRGQVKRSGKCMKRKKPRHRKRSARRRGR